MNFGKWMKIEPSSKQGKRLKLFTLNDVSGIENAEWRTSGKFEIMKIKKGEEVKWWK